MKADLVAIDNGLEKVVIFVLLLVDTRKIPKALAGALIAQDVQKVLPEAVDAGDPEKLSLRYTEVIPLLVAALNEAKERIEVLESLVSKPETN